MYRFLLSLVLIAAVPALAWPQEYQLPPREIVELLDAPPSPTVRLSPDARWMVIVERSAMPSIADVARPWIGLAGLRIDPVRHARHQVSFDSGLVLRDLTGTVERRIALPEGARISGLDWSHTSDRFAVTLAEDDRVELWVCETADPAPRRIAARLNPVLAGYDWMPDGVRLVVSLVPDARGALPERPLAPGGPTMMESSGRKSPARTFQDLLADEHDALLFQHFVTAQVAIIDTRTGETTRLGAPGMISSVQPSPDGQHVLVAELQRPFSYVLPYTRFPEKIEVWNTAGEVEHTVAALPLADTVPIEGVPEGPRGIRWRPGVPTTLVWVEALDGGDPKREVPHRDKWMTVAAPFSDPPREMLRTKHRARGLTWFAEPRLVLAAEYDRDRRWLRATLYDLDGDEHAGVVLEDRSIHDRYGHPGTIAMQVQPDGTRIARQSGDWIYRLGEGDSPEGSRPFVDRQHLGSRAAERLWRCGSGEYETPVAIVEVSDDAVPRIVTRHETPDTPPNLRLRDLASGAMSPLTEFPDPQPQIRGIQKHLVTYERADGVQLSATIHLPAGYQPGTRLPLVVWAYPLEYTDPATAGQIGGSPYRFTQIRGPSPLMFLTQGYCVMENATMPIVGHPETMNDSFVKQIASSAAAAIDKAAAMGVADPARVGVGGHSYGAFMTANLLAHTDLFRAGIARSGAFNRTLTPFGFQAERRTLWEAPQIYAAVSPFMHADKIDEPLLLIHGVKDSNSGTYPMQSERLYQAIAGHGGTVRLVMLPEEDHGYVARESVLHAAAEMVAWFNRHVKPEP